MKAYELMLVIDPVLGEEKIGELIVKIEGKIKGFGGEIEKTDKWGTKNLSSVFRNSNKLTQGYYAVVFFKAPTTVPAELRAYLKVNESVIRSFVYNAEEKPPVETERRPVERTDAVEVGEIKGAEEAFGQS